MILIDKKKNEKCFLIIAREKFDVTILASDNE